MFLLKFICSRIVVAILLLVLYDNVRRHLIKDYLNYLKGISAYNTWIGSDFKYDILEKSMEVRFLENFRHLIRENVSNTKYYNLPDIASNFLYEDHLPDQVRTLYIQLPDRNLPARSHKSMSVVCDYIHSIPTSYSCLLCVLLPKKIITFPIIPFKGVYTHILLLQDVNDLELLEGKEKKEIRNSMCIDTSNKCSLKNNSEVPCLFIATDFMREVKTELNLLVTLCDRIAGLTSRFV